MKNRVLKLGITLTLVMMVSLAHAATFYSAAGTTDPSILTSWWTNTNGTGAHPANFTNPADIFIVQSGHIMTAINNWTITGTLIVNGTFNGNNKDQVVRVLMVNVGGILNASTSGNHKLTVNGATTISGTINFFGNQDMTFIGPVIINPGGMWIEPGPAKFFFSGGLTNNGTFTSNTGVHEFVTNAQTVTGTLIIPNVRVNGVNLTNNGNLTISNAVTEGGASTITQAANATLNLGGNINLDNLNASATGNTVIYSAAGNQTVKQPVTNNYYNLTLTGSGTKSITTANIIVNGTLSMEGTATTNNPPTYAANATLRYNTATNRTAGPEWITPFAATGGVVIANTGTITMNAAKVFNCGIPLTINSGATLITSNFALTFGGNFIRNGTLTAGSSAITIGTCTVNQSISGFTTTGTVSMTKTGGTATFTGNVNGGALTINGTGGTLSLGAGLTHTFSGVVSLTNGTLKGSSSTLNVTAISATAWNGTGANFMAETSTVNFSGAGNQTLSASSTTFNNVTFSGGGNKTISNSMTVIGTMSVATGTIMILATGTMSPVYALILGGVPQIGGSWGNTNSTAMNQNNTFFGGAAGATGIINASLANRFVITGSTTQTAGTPQNLTITVKSPSGATITTYTGDHILTFSGAGASPNNTLPIVTDNTGTPIAFGSPTTITFVNGVATVSGGSNGVMTLYKIEIANIAVTDGTLVSQGNDNLVVTVSVGTFSLFFTTQPGGGLVNSIWSTQPVITVADAFGNLATGTPRNITLSIQNNAGPGGTLGGTTTIAMNTATAQATFTNLSIDVAGAGYTLSSSSPGLVNATSQPFNITNPVPTISNIGPASTCAGGNDFNLVAIGSNFNTQSVLQFDGSPVTTVFVNSGEVFGMIPAASIAVGGIHTITVFNPIPGGGTSSSLNFVVTQTIVTPAVTQPTCFSAGQIALTISGNGTAPFMYDWADLAGTNNIKDRVGLLAGSYSVTVTDANGCQVSSGNLDLVAATGCIGVSVCQSDMVSMFSTDPDPANDSYTWTVPPDAIIVSGQGTPSITIDWSMVPIGTYGICVTGNNTCGSSPQTCQEVYVIAPVISAYADPVCAGGILNLYAFGGESYSWSGPNAFASQSQYPVIYNATSINAGTYTVTVTDMNGCAASTTVAVIVTTPPSITGLVTNTNCGEQIGAINITVTGGSGFTYLWNTGVTTEDLTLLFSGNYTVTVTNDSGCSAVRTFSVNDITGPTVTVSTITPVACYGASTGAINITVSGGTAPYTYDWSNGANTEDISALATGPYSVVVVDALGCQAGTVAPIIVPQPSGPAQVDSVVTNVNCFGTATGAIALTVTGGTPGYTYDWADIAGTSNPEDRTGLIAGSYTVTITDNAACTLVKSFIVSQPDAALSASTTMTDVSCNGGANGTINLTVMGGTSPYSYNWGGGIITQDRAGVAAGIYIVTVTDDNGCTTTASSTILEPAILSAGAIASLVSCNGGSNGSINLTVMGGTPTYTYLWSNGAIVEDPSGLIAGIYSVTVTDALGCTTTASATVTEPTIVVATISDSTNTSCFGSADGTATVLGSGGTPGYTYLWSNGQTTETATGLAAGTYSVTVTDLNLCTGQAFVTIIQPATLNIVPFSTNVSCNGGSDGAINLDVSGGTSPYTFVWADGNMMQNRTDLTAGIYSVTVTDANTCTATASDTITAPSLLIASAMPINITCDSANDGQIDLTVMGGTPPYAYAWSNAASIEDISALAPGTYSVTVTDNLGCTATTSAMITQPEELSVTGVSIDNCAITPNGSIDITATGGTSPYSYVWSDNNTDEDRMGLPAGLYMVIVTDAMNCTDTASFTLGEIEVEPTSYSPSCANNDGEVYTTLMHGTAPFTFSWTGPGGFAATTQNISGLMAGTYFVTITDSQGCSVATSATLILPSCLSPLAGDDEFTTCAGQPVMESVASNDTDMDNSPAELIYLPLQSPATEQGVIVWDSTYNGAFTFTPTPGYNGIVMIEYSVEDTLGLSDVGLLTIYVSNMIAEITAANTTQIVCDGGTGTATVTHIGGFAPQTYLWSNGQTTATATGLAAGTYTVTVTDARGCMDTVAVLISNFCFTVVKTQTGGPVIVDAAGQVITYTIVVANTGDADVTSIVPMETYPGAGTGTLSPPVESISPNDTLNIGETWTYTATYTTTQADIDAAIPLVNTISVVSLEVPGPIIDTATTQVNDIPVAIDDANTTMEDTPVMGDASTNDMPSGDGGNMWTLVGTDGGASNGSVVMNPDGTYTYTPDPEFNGMDTITYIVCDVDGDCDTAVIIITILPVNDVPVAVDDANTTNEDTPVMGDASTNDTPSGDGGNMWTLVGPDGGATNGSVTMNPDGTYTYTPDPEFNGMDTITYIVCDVDGDCDTAVIIITITAVNDVPVAVDDANTTMEDTPVMGDASTNDTPSGDGGNMWTLVGTDGGATNGSVVMNPDGTYTYTPDPDFNGMDTITYMVCDTNGDCSTAEIIITVTAVNDVPVAIDDANTTMEDTPVMGDASTNDTPSGDGGNMWTLVGPDGGAMNGTVVMDTNGMYIYTPDPDFNGLDTITYVVCDVDGDCDTAVIIITITEVNDVPVAVDDANTTMEDTPVMGDASTNDTPSGDGGNMWTLVGVDGGATNGSVSMNPDGTYTYTPDPNFNGLDTITYMVCDTNGDCDTAVIIITITAVNDVPVAVDDVNTTMEDTPVTGDASTNDTPSGDGGNTWMLVGPDGGAMNGTVVIDTNGMYTYTPDPDFNGMDTITYIVCDVDGDCDTAVIIITILPVNDVPVAVDDTNTTMEDTPVTGDASTNDTPSGDGGNMWTLVGVDGGASNGSVVMNPDGTYTYTPDPDFNGMDTITYIVCDVDGDCDTAVIIITILPVNDVPVAVDDVNTTNEDTPVVGDASTNDTPSGDGGNMWTLVGVDGGAMNGTVVMNPDGTYTYTPDPDFNGLDTIDYRVCDVDGDCDTAIIIITILPTDDMPVAVDDVNTTPEDTPVTGDASTNDTPSGDGDNTWMLVGPDGGAMNGMVVMDTNGMYTYTPDPDFNGLDTITYIVCDVDGDCDTAVIIITILPVDDIPVAIDDMNTTPEDTPVTGDASTNDTPSGDGDNTWMLVGPDGGAMNGTVVMDTNGMYTYTPDPDFNGMDTITYIVCDVDGDCDTAVIIITITAVNDAPVAVDDVNTTNEDTPVSGDASTNDTPSGDGGNMWTLVGVDGGATNGSVSMNPDGTYTYTPDPDFNGMDTITYIVCDVDGDCDTAVIIITILPVNDVPVAVDDANTTNEDTPVMGDASTNDTPSGDGGNMWTLVGVDGGATNGSVTMNPDGTYTYTPDPNFNGLDTIDYRVCDVDGDCDTAIIIITILPVDDIPIAVDDANTTNEDTPVSGDASTNDTPSGDGGNMWTLVGVDGGATNGSVSMNPDGTYTYTPDPDFNGLDTITYIICDVDDDCDTAVIIITITAVDDMPLAVDDTNTTNEDTPVSGDASTNDTPSGDGDNMWMLVGPDGGAMNGTVVMDTNGMYTYTPDPDFNGLDTITYIICDVDDDCDTAVIIITITAMDDMPLAVDDTNTTNEDTPVSGDASTNDTPSGDGDNMWMLVGPDGGAMNGTVVMDTNGMYTYTPDPDFNGMDTITYIVCDVDGDCDTAVIIIIILPVNDVPVAVDDMSTTNEDTPVSGDASTNDTPSGDGGNMWTLVGVDGGATNGSVVMNPDGTYTYTPDPDFNGLDTITYIICDVDGDCDTAVIIITILPVNDVPVAVDDANTTNEDTPVSGDASTNDTPSGDGDNMWMLDGPDGGAMNGTVVMDTNGMYTYTPDPDFNGMDTITYVVCDGDGDCDTAVIIITITAVDDMPLAVDDTNTTNEDTPVSGDASTNDTPSGDGDNMWMLVGPDGGAMNGTVVMDTNGMYTYTPDPDFNGMDTITYIVCDIDGDCDTAVIIITILPLNDVPVAVDDTNTTMEDTPVTGDASTNDTPSGDGGNMWTLVGTDGGATNGSVTMNPDGTYTYTPDPDFNGMDTITYIVCDIDGDCDTAVIIITILPLNDVPVAVDDTNTTMEDTPVTGDASTNDTPSGDGGNMWTLVGVDGGAMNGTVVMDTNGMYTYTPDPDFNGMDTITYVVCDVDGDCDTAVIIITILPVNDVPVAVDDMSTTNEDTPVSGDASTNDTPSGDGGNMWTLVGTDGGASNGSVVMNPDGTYTYTPDPDFNGLDTITYIVCDVDGDCDTAVIIITVLPVDDIPVAVDDANTTNEDTPVMGDASTNDTPSADGGNMWTLVGTDGGAMNGTVVMDTNGMYTYTPDPDFNGMDTITYVICDVDGDCDTAVIIITITAVNDVPVAVDDMNTTSEDTPVTGDASTNDTPSGDGGNTWMLVGLDGGAMNGTVMMDTNGIYTYTPDPNFNGMDTITYVLCDVDGDCDTAIIVITITPDALLPTVSCAVQATPIECPESPVFIPPMVTEFCDPFVLTSTDTITPGSCGGTYSVTRTWTATDDCGNSSTCSATIVVQDLTVPVISCPADVTIECTDSTSPDSTGMASATDTCDPAPVVTYGDVTIAGTCPQEYTINRTWTATDSCGNTSTCLQLITIEDTTPPSIVCPADVTIECTASTSPDSTGIASATDNCDPAPVVTYSDLASPGACLQGSSIVRTWVATDACGNSSTCVQNILLEDATPPSITCPVDVTIECSDSTSPDSTGIASATDNCDPAPAVTFSDVTAAGACLQAYTITRTWTTTDACGNATNCIQVLTVEDTTPPSIVCPEDVTIECTDSTTPDSTGIASATDNCDTAPIVTYSEVVTPGACSQEMSIARTWLATDACGNSSTCLQTITVQDTTAPVITCPADVTLECTDSTSPDSTGLASATDNCDTAPIVTYSEVVTPGACPQEMSIVRTWVATDACGNSATCEQSISIQDTTPPSIVCPADVTVECTASTSPDSTGIASATDNCDPAPVVTYSDVVSQGTCPQGSSIVRTWVATDACGNSSTCVQNILLEDATPPSITCPVDVTIECSDSTSPDSTGIASAADNCDPAPAVTFSDVIAAGACPQAYTITRTWTTTDACGNATNCIQVLTVEDTTPPSIVCPVDVTIECSDSTTPDSTGIASATDNCDTAPIVTYSEVVTPGACPQEMSIARTWLATDACGNSSTCLQTITVQDTTAPVITCPADVTLECTDSTSPDSTGIASATDNCDTAPIVTYSEVVTPGACPQEMSIVRTWVATDACGNSATCEQSISIQDTTPPSIVCPSDVTVECTALTSPDSTGIASATDNCDPAPVVTYSDVVSQGTCPQGSSIVRTWVATDACGNSTTCVQNILLEDATPPSITCPVDVTIECSDSTSPDSTGIASATDNCDPAPAVTFSDITAAGACLQAYTITRTWTTTDACGNATNCIQVLTVEDTTPPSIVCPEDVTIECTDSTTPDSAGIASATDNCDTAPIVTYSEVVTPGACSQEMSIARTWLATDACGNSSTCLQTITVQDTTAPVITCPADVTLECTDSTSPDSTGLASATDNCDTAPIVTYSEVVTPGACPQELSIVRTWLATDACGNSSTCDQIITVQDTVAPVVTCPEDVTIDCLADSTPESTGFASATDNCDQQLPGVGYADVTIEDGCPEIIERTWTSTDACGNIGSCVQTITIVDTTPPTITCPTDVTVECAADVPVVNTDDVTVTDDCGLVTVTHQEDIVTDSTCVNRYNISRVYLATDDCGNTSTCAQVIAIFDDTPPTITCPTDVTVECASEVPAADPTTVTATDNCTGATTVTSIGDVITNMTCTNRFTLTRTYQAVDACGNTATCIQVINVFDSTPPTITCPANVTVACAGMVPPVNIGSVVSSDNCGGTATVTHLGDVISGQVCPNIFVITRTYQAVDACGNSSTCAQIISIIDNVPPTITCPPSIVVPIGSDLSPMTTGVPTGTDNCGGTPVFTFTDVSVAGACPGEFMITRTWTGADDCGVMITCLQTIAVDANCNLDLALTKTLIGPTDVQGGDDVLFNITVLNEGDADVGSVTITDYIPLGFTLNDPDWTPGVAGSTGQSASIILSVANGGLDANGLNPGESVTVQITLQADPDIQSGSYINLAEISTILDLLGNDISDQDIDSDADDDDINDIAGEDDINGADICVSPVLEITGDAYVCPGTIATYCVTNYNSDFTYNWVINNGGTIIANTGECITVEWQVAPGGPFEISVNALASSSCNTVAFMNVYIQGVETLSCNDHVQISLGDSCETVVLSGMILEGEAEGNNNYFVIITDENGNVIPDATLTSEHVGECFTVMVANECNDQSCWGTICVEDKIPPVIECTDVTVSCGSSLEPVFEPAETGTASLTETPGLPIGPNAGTVTTHEMVLDVPANAVVTDVNITIDLAHTWVGDLTAELISPSGTTILLADQICGSVDNWELVVFDDQAGISVTDACNPIPPALDGSVIPQGTLSSINGQSAVGTWRVVITDQVGGDGGTLNLVTLDVDYFLAVPTAPTATDACGEVTLTYTDVESGDACEELLLTRTWVATDGSGNTATCVQTITITPLTLDNVDFPEAYVGVCGESIHPDHTGWPTVDGTPITDENDLCNIFVGYWDKVLNECGGGSKIVRTWTVLNWCTVEFVEAVQVIKLEDNVGPELTCPEDFEVGTDFWYCFANVSVPKPIAVDECSEIATYELESTSGIIVSFGNNFVINGLEIGTHTVTWIVTDECGNSSTCSFNITVVDDVVPVANCDLHTIVALTNDGPSGITLVPATVFDDGSYDNCGPVTFRARRMDSCIDFDWTTEGACIDDVPGGIPPVNSRDRGTVHRPCVPFACCDVGAGPIMVELEVTDAAGNVNYCMIEATVQDKISPLVICPPDIIVSCDFWFNVEEGTFSDSPLDHSGNGNGNLDEDPLSAVFGNMFDAFTYNDDESVRQDIVINDPGNDDFSQPHFWGIDGWADDNCEVNLSVRVRIVDDCSGDDLPGNAPDGAVKLIERRFSAVDGNEGNAPGTCTQRIWVVDFDPFYITDNTCNNPNPQDGVIWPCDVLLTTCPEDLGNTGEPTVFDDACSLIGVTYEDQRFDFVDGACFKILREWAVIDWCQYDPQTGAGLWHYTQVIKVHDQEGPEFAEDCVTEVLCVADTGVTLPANNQAFLGEENPLASSCSAHLNLRRTVHETCSDLVTYDVKIYPFNGTDYILVAQGTAPVDSSNNAVLGFDTRQSTIQSIRLNGIPYNSAFCGDYHRILWTVEDGCGNFSTCEYLFRLEDCKQPSPVCINGLSTVVMPIGGEVSVWAKDFNASSFDDCTPAADLLYSFSGDSYQPSFTYDCDNVPAFNVEIATQIWVADGGTDDNCNGIISWEERNKDYCTATIVITDNAFVCDSFVEDILAGEILTEHTDAVGQVHVTLISPNHFFPVFVTAQDGKFAFNSVPYGDDYTITPERNDAHRNGVSTLDLVRIQKHLLGKELFTSAYQYIAADANNTESVSAIDLIEIRKLILGIYTEYPSNKSWRFVEKDFPMNSEHPWPFGESIELPDLGATVLDNDFVGVKIGDVNNSVQANANQVLPRNGRRVLTVDMDAPANVVAGERVQVKLTIPEMVEGFQWTLETEGLTFENISSEVMKISDNHVGVLHDGVMTMSWNAEDAYSTGQVMYLNFIATASGNISGMIHMSSKVTEAEAYTLSGEILDVKLGHTGLAPEFALYQNNPNPWNELTTIGFDLPADDVVKFTIFEASGKVVKTIESEFKAGYNTITLRANELPASGVMYYRLESGEYSASKKMVLIK